MKSPHKPAPSAVVHLDRKPQAVKTHRNATARPRRPFNRSAEPTDPHRGHHSRAAHICPPYVSDRPTNPVVPPYLRRRYSRKDLS
jgi:hypothetical protein